MVRIAVGFAIGVGLFQQQSEIPSLLWLWPGLPALWLGIRFPAVRIFSALVLGFCWALAYAQATRPDYLPSSFLGQDILIEGRIRDIPAQQPGRSRFLFDVESIVKGERRVSGNWRFSITWYEDIPELWAGDVWRLPVRLRKARGMANPGGFDYQRWLYVGGIRYTGYVKDAAGAQRLSQQSSLNRVRQSIAQKISAVVDRAQGVMRALVVGDRTLLGETERALFARTGTSHLVAISGLHIGMVAGVVYFLVQALWRRVPLFCRRLPASVAAAPAAMVTALGYSALAGFSIPTQRALIMLCVTMIAIMLRRPGHAWSILSLALLLVLLWDPLSVLSAGFWLSFTAVVVILYAMLSCPEKYSWIYIQFAVAIGLAPVLLMHQLNPSILAPLVNTIAIPLFTFLLIPLLFIAVLLVYLWSDGGAWLLKATGNMLDQGLSVLARVAQYHPEISFPLDPEWHVIALAVISVVLLLAPRGVPGRYLGILMLSPLVFPQNPQALKSGEFLFTLLDVGQGLAAVVETENHVLLFDTGPSFRSGFDTGSAVVIPFLRHRGIREVDTLIVSHGDTDHMGGTKAVVDKMRVNRLLSGEPHRLSVDQVNYCMAGQRWKWDGVSFQVLFPFSPGGEGNNASCVIRISNEKESLLLTGDIEGQAERRLVDRYGINLRSTMVVAAHHGSSSSSSDEFVAATRPQYILFPSGYKNRWGFPAEEVVARWTRAGALPLNTGLVGAIQGEFNQDGLEKPVLHRESYRRYWH